jgi:NAD(P)H-hydrate epimerase
MYLSRAQVREIDHRAAKEFGVPSIVLMENAGRGAAEWLMSMGAGGKVLVCCGKGNNGGDGLVIARHLDLHGLAVRVLLFTNPDELSGDAATNWTIAARSRIPIDVVPRRRSALSLPGELLTDADWLVDALFGTGLTGEVRPPWDHVITWINASHSRVLAVDIPSGLDCDSGEPLGCAVKATHTATFVAPKKGFTNPRSAPWTGKIRTISIGAPRVLLEQYLASVPMS